MCSRSSEICKVQIKISLRIYFAPVTMTIINKIKIKNYGKMVGKKETLYNINGSVCQYDHNGKQYQKTKTKNRTMK